MSFLLSSWIEYVLCIKNIEKVVFSSDELAAFDGQDLGEANWPSILTVIRTDEHASFDGQGLGWTRWPSILGAIRTSKHASFDGQGLS